MKGFCPFLVLLALAPRGPTKGFCSILVCLPLLQEASESHLASPGRKVASFQRLYVQSLDFSEGVQI